MYPAHLVMYYEGLFVCLYENSFAYENDTVELTLGQGASAKI